VLLIEEVAYRVFKRFDTFPMTEPDALRKQLERFHRDDHLVYCRDIKKCGMTMPRNLLEIAIRCINKSTGSELPEKFFSTFTVFEEGEESTFIKSVRGHGQGMANALTSLI